MIAEAEQPVRSPEHRWVRVQLLGGLMVSVYTAYCGPRARTGKGRGSEGSGIYPELAVLGVTEGASPGLASLLGRLTALLPSYELTQQELELRGLPLDIKVAHRLVAYLGTALLTTRTRDLLLYRQGKLPAGNALAGKRVGVAIDGGRVRIRRYTRKQKGRGKGKKQRRRYRVEWREPKVLIIFEMDRDGRMLAHSRPWIDGTFAGPDELMELLAMHLHRLGAAQAERVVFLSDGAPWIWDRLAWVEKRVGLKEERVRRVLDWCHAVHHIGLVLQALHLEMGDHRRLFKKFRKWLRQGAAARVVAELTRLAGHQPKDSSVWTDIAFLQKHHDHGHMNYAALRRQGSPLGSGAIESTIRRVINLRLKGNGITWLKENAEAMLLIRAQVLTRRWEESLAHMRESMARNRRRDWAWTSPDMPAQLQAGVPIEAPVPQPQQLPRPNKAAA